MSVVVRNTVFELDVIVPEGGYKAGHILNFNDKSWVMQGLQDAVEGDKRTFRSDLVVEIDKTTATDVFDAGDIIGFTVDGLTAELAGAGDYDLFGAVRKASGSGVKTVLFALNENVAASA